MSNKYKIGFAILLTLLVAIFFAILLQGSNIAVLNPQGDIASQQRQLMIIATLLMLIVVLPVFALTFAISWKYRASNKSKTKYTPNHDSDHKLEIVWWSIPFIIITILSIIIWQSSHKLDPYRPLDNSKAPITIQVVSLEWKWLFIYPDHGIATVNYLQIPEDTPINFKLTSDASMNSFWIPQLGGQVYTMAAMETKLHLIANNPGEYIGQSANLSGDGFAGMRFTAKATSFGEFDKWIQTAKQSPIELSQEEYKKIAEPSKNNPPAMYTYNDKRVYNEIIEKYLGPEGSKKNHAH